MDWLSWLSKTTLDPSLVCEYGLTFEQNQLEADDLPYFNHEFLQSMGISVAKHRLEILKLASKETGPTRGSASTNGFSKLVSAIARTRKSIRKRISKLVSPSGEREERAPPAVPELEWRAAAAALTPPPQLPVLKRRQAKSGPLDFKRVQQEGLVYSKSKSSLKLSGPLDGKAHERLVFAYRSPKICATPPADGVLLGQVSPRMGVARPMEARRSSPMVRSGNGTPRGGRNYYGGGDVEFDEQSLWTALFQDMKPT
ncbi:unnamed protein product [Linum trigynum]|uniref:SAM domain-containing protein n=1 Tax=Linum trigynum TaxID=586398 RepID=A0AAV2CQX6_9ROSI